MKFENANLEDVIFVLFAGIILTVLAFTVPSCVARTEEAKERTEQLKIQHDKVKDDDK